MWLTRAGRGPRDFVARHCVHLFYHCGGHFGLGAFAGALTSARLPALAGALNLAGPGRCRRTLAVATPGLPATISTVA